jgi:cystathionine beta-lyase
MHAAQDHLARRHPLTEFKQLNTPIYRASTVVFDDLESFLGRGSRLFDGYMDGLYGTPTVRELERRVAGIEGGARSIAVPSGQSALTSLILALCQPGDHVLMVDCIYGGTRGFAASTLARMGIAFSFIPSDAGSIAEHLRPTTRLVLLESPGSYSMEVQDIAPVAAEAKAAGVTVAIDNTWGFGASRMFEHGVDVCVTALSKYAAGGGDLCMGSITVATEDLYRTIKAFVAGLGSGVSVDDAYMVLRGLDSLEARLARHAERGLEISHWLAAQPQVHAVLNPALPGDRSHDRFRRYFTAGNGLLSIRLRNGTLDGLRPFFDGLETFRIGASWGSAHSLVALARPHGERTVDSWTESEHLLRLHIGLEDMDAIRTDLENALARLPGAAVKAAQ